MSYRLLLCVFCCLTYGVGAHAAGFAEALIPVTLAEGDTILPADVAYRGYRLNIRNVEVIDQKGTRYLLKFDAVNTGRRPITFGPGFPLHYLQTVFDNTLSMGGLLPFAPILRAELSKSSANFKVGQWQTGLTQWIDAGREVKRQELKTDEFEYAEVRVRRTASNAQRAPAGSLAPSTQSSSPDSANPSCVDITIQEIRVLINTKGKATLQLYLENTSNQDIDYAKLAEDIGIDFYLGGAPKITASSRRIGQLNVSEKLKALKDQKLAPGAKAVLIQRVSTADATRYTGVVTAQFDPGQQLAECDETNNEASVLLFD